MKNFFKYFLLLVGDILGVHIVASLLIKTFIYSMLGDEYHHVYMIIRIALIIAVFVISSLFMNYKNSEKIKSYKTSNRMSLIINGELSYREMILSSKLFKNECLSFSVFMTFLTIIMLPSLYRLGGALLVILGIFITVTVVITYLITNYKLNKKILNTIVTEKSNIGACYVNKNN